MKLEVYLPAWFVLLAFKTLHWIYLSFALVTIVMGISFIFWKRDPDQAKAFWTTDSVLEHGERLQSLYKHEVKR